MESTNKDVKAVLKKVGSKFQVKKFFEEDWNKLLTEVHCLKDYQKCLNSLHGSARETFADVTSSLKVWSADIPNRLTPCPITDSFCPMLPLYQKKEFTDSLSSDELRRASRSLIKYCKLLNSFYFQKSSDHFAVNTLLDILVKLKHLEDCFTVEDLMIKVLKSKIQILENSVRILALKYGIKQAEIEADVSM